MTGDDTERFVVAGPVERLIPDGTAHCPEWCATGPHTIVSDQVAVSHAKQVGTFNNQGDIVTVSVFWAEALDRPSTRTPIVMLTRQDLGHDLEASIGLDLADHQARDLAMVLGGLDPGALLQFGAALAQAAGLLGYQANVDEAL